MGVSTLCVCLLKDFVARKRRVAADRAPTQSPLEDGFWRSVRWPGPLVGVARPLPGHGEGWGRQQRGVSMGVNVVAFTGVWGGQPAQVPGEWEWGKAHMFYCYCHLFFVGRGPCCSQRNYE